MASDPADLLIPKIPADRPYRRIGAIANRTIPQLSPWLAAAPALDMLHDAGPEQALVVDADGTPVGLVTATRLAGARPDARLEELMTPVRAVLHENVPASIAASLMASLPADCIAVVSDTRRAVGIVTAVELLQWSLGVTAR